MTPPANPLGLVADVGGTNARFALTDLTGDPADLVDCRSLPTCDFASLQHAARHYLAGTGSRPQRAAIAVASPVDADEIRLTNRAWSFSRSELQRELELDDLLLLNDFGAVAWAAPSFEPSTCVRLYGPENPALRGPVTVLGPGTGLGVALLVGSTVDGWHAVETEGGHVTFAPIGDEEQAVARWVTAHFGRASNERVLCGKGLSHIDAVLRHPAGIHAPASTGQEPPLRDPADIVESALRGNDLVARRALARFCAILGSVAGDAALIHGARTVLIAGGMVPRFVPFLRSSAFRERFLQKGRFAPYLESVAIHVITHPHPGLLGAARALRLAPRR